MVLVAVPMSMQKSPLQGLMRVVLFALGLSITLTAYGAALAYIGGKVGFIEIQRGLFLLGGTVAYVFGLWMMKLVSLRLPETNVPAWVQRAPGWVTPFATGLALGNWGIGCPDPVFYVLLVYLAGIGDVGQGAAMTAAYAAGRSLPIVGLAVLGLLGINTIPALVKRRALVDRFFGWVMVAMGGFMLSSLLFGMWFEATWVHEGWNWLLHRLNENWGEIRAADHAHVHGGGSIIAPIAFVTVAFLVPGAWLWLKGLARQRVALLSALGAVLVFLFFFLPTAIDPELPERLGAELRPAPVQTGIEHEASHQPAHVDEHKHADTKASGE